MSDRLNEYVRTGSSDAFRHLVQEHVDAVYSQCLRQLRQSAWAEDVTQTVFILLARKAGKISANAVLEGWLFNATRYSCAHALRAAARRRSIEQKAARMRTEVISSSESDDNLRSEAERILDAAIAHLGERDRNAVLLRFFQQQSLREVGEALGISENAAKQRVFRAVEKLRAYFGTRGLNVPSTTVVAWLEVAVKPAGSQIVHAVLKGVAAKCVVGGSIHATGIFSRLRWISPKIAAGAAVAIAVTAGIVASEYCATAQLPSPAQAPTAQAAPQTAMPILADVPPSTQPSDQTTPSHTLAKLCAAIQLNDRAAISECLCDDGTDPASANLARAFFDEEAGIYQVEKAWQTKFGARIAVPDLTFDFFPGCGGFDMLLERLIELPNGPEVQIEGDSARVRVTLPPEMFAGTGIHRIAALGRWSGAMLILKHVDGSWKLDTGRTLNMLAVVDRQWGNKEDAQVLEQKIAEDLASHLNEIAQKLANGSITSRPEAITAVRTAVVRGYNRAGIAGNIQFMALPVVGG
jgi:RNA polymerase sigma factor (sigma-70 family)